MLVTELRGCRGFKSLRGHKLSRIIKPEEAILVTRQCLRDNFPLYQEAHKVDSSLINSINLWIGYRTIVGNPFEILETTHFDVNVMGDICFLVAISLENQFRGKGLGWKLYESVHDIAKRIGCERVRTFPSGGFFEGRRMIESREDYLLKRGYVRTNGQQVDLILQ